MVVVLDAQQLNNQWPYVACLTFAVCIMTYGHRHFGHLQGIAVYRDVWSPSFWSLQ